MAVGQGAGAEAQVGGERPALSRPTLCTWPHFLVPSGQESGFPSVPGTGLASREGAVGWSGAQVYGTRINKLRGPWCL